MSSRSRYFRVFRRELKHYRRFHSLVYETMLSMIPTRSLLKVRKKLKEEGSFFTKKEPKAIRYESDM